MPCPAAQGTWGRKPSLGEGTEATGKATGTPKATGLDKARRTNGALQRTPERHAAGHNHGTGPGARQQPPLVAENPESTHNTKGAHDHPKPGPTHKQTPSKPEPGTAGKAKTRAPTTALQTPARMGEAQVWRAHQIRHPNAQASNGGVKAKPEPTHKDYKPEPGTGTSRT